MLPCTSSARRVVRFVVWAARVGKKMPRRVEDSA